MVLFPILSGIWALVVLALFIAAIRMSYAIERRAGPPNRTGLPRYTNIFASAFGSKGGGDAEVVAMRRNLRLLLLAILVLFALFAALLPVLRP